MADPTFDAVQDYANAYSQSNLDLSTWPKDSLVWPKDIRTVRKIGFTALLQQFIFSVMKNGRAGVAVLGPRTSERLLRASWLAVVARILLIAGLITTPVALLNYELWEFLYLMFLAAFAVVMTVYLGLALVLKCPDCGKRFLIESTEPKHPAARRAKHFDHWGTLVLSIMRNREFTCMHCGSLYRRE
jgi:DNA-directed RNA polymerase subunit RPC12/RpoP